MKKATKLAMEKTLQPYIGFGRHGLFIENQDVNDVMRLIMSEYSNVYCGVEQNKMGGMVFSVRSTAKSRTKFIEIAVK